MRGRIPVVAGLAVVLAVVVAGSALHAQVPASVREKVLREARELARMGNHEAAIRRVEPLYERAPLDGKIVEGLARLLLEANRFERAEEILVAYTAKRSDDTRAVSTLASVHFKAGEKAAGMEILNRLVDGAPGELWPYQMGLDARMAARMNEEIAGFIAQARDALGDSTLFAVEAAQAHREAGRFGTATREYLRAGLARNMSAEISSEYIVRMAEDSEARPAIITALERAGSIAAFVPAVARSIWTVHLMNEDCGLALEEVARLVELDPSRAGDLIIFARKAYGAGCYGQCAEAYDLVLAHLDKPEKAPEYLVEKGRCELAAGMTETALATFDMVAGEYRSHKAADEALMERARILRDRGDVAGAIADAERVMTSKYADNVCKAVLFKGDCQVLAGNLDGAFETYDRVTTDWASACAQEAFFNLGEISLYRGEFDDAQSYYNVTLRQYPDEPRANDAIDRLLLIKSSGGEGAYMPGLKEFGRALLLSRRGEAAEAIALLRELGGLEGEGLVRVESLKALAEIYVGQGSIEDGIRLYKLIGDSLETPAAAAALEAVGDVYLDLGRVDDAVSAYEDVILKFPGSVSAGEARRKIDLATRGPDDEA